MAQQVEGIIADGDALDLTDPIYVSGHDDSGNNRGFLTDNAGRLITISNVSSEVAGPTQGPATATLSSGTNVTLVAAPGVGFSILVPTIQFIVEDNSSSLVAIVKEGAGGLARLTFATKVTGVYPAFPMDPPWKLAENTALVAQRIVGNKDIIINYHYFVEAT